MQFQLILFFTSDLLMCVLSLPEGKYMQCIHRPKPGALFDLLAPKPHFFHLDQDLHTT